MNQLNDRYLYSPEKDLLGKGGFSTVYRAYDSHEKRFVALKFFTGTIGNKYDLEAEFRIAQRLTHPNLIRMYEVLTIEKEGIHGAPVKSQIGVLEYADLGDLKAFTNNNKGRLTAAQTDHLIADILKGLVHIHQNKIIHRDLKPQNILIQQDGEGIIAKITDFGISKALDQEGSTHTSQLLGSIEYMAPEQFNPGTYGLQGQLHTNLDLWSFGVILTELINGRPVFGRRSSHRTAEQIMNTILKNPLPPPVVLRMKKPYPDILRQCLVRQAGDRAQDASGLLALLEPHLEWPRPTGTFQPKLPPSSPGTEPMTQKTEEEEPRKPKIIIRPARLLGNEAEVRDRPTRPRIVIRASPIKEKARNRHSSGNRVKMLLFVLLFLLLLGTAGFLGYKLWFN